jgi:hypothetical protein
MGWDGWMDGWTDGRADGRTGRWTDRQTDRQAGREIGSGNCIKIYVIIHNQHQAPTDRNVMKYS